VQIAQAQKSLKRGLIANGEATPLDTQVLLAHILDRPRAWVLAHPEYELDANQSDALQNVLAQIAAKIPLPYILGHWEFYGLDFNLNPQVIIPRPETELLVETALHWLASHPRRRWALDVGTGSGCIAVTLAHHQPDLNVIASDLSLPALLIAGENANRHGVTSQVALVCCDLLPPSSTKFDLICSNPPYIPTQTLKGLPIFRREPTLALDGGSDGLTYIRRLLQEAILRLAPGGLLLCEIASDQGWQVTALASAFYPQAQVKVLQDLAGLDRLLCLQT
jgi:release factor glutamine methyltransferase